MIGYLRVVPRDKTAQGSRENRVGITRHFRSRSYGNGCLCSSYGHRSGCYWRVFIIGVRSLHLHGVCAHAGERGYNFAPRDTFVSAIEKSRASFVGHHRSQAVRLVVIRGGSILNNYLVASSSGNLKLFFYIGSPIEAHTSNNHLVVASINNGIDHRTVSFFIGYRIINTLAQSNSVGASFDRIYGVESGARIHKGLESHIVSSK